jgi:phosphoribosylamine---glycine ligase
MRVNVVDTGGRGQALAGKLASEGHELFVSPGNPGNSSYAYSTGVRPTDIVGQLEVARLCRIDFTVVGSDDALALGIVDAFQNEGRDVFGPTQEQARIESDRAYAKRTSCQLGVPTGPYNVFTDKREAIKYAKTRPWPLFVKDNELAQGKGTIKCADIDEFAKAIKPLGKMVVEDYVIGSEASHHAFCDGETEVSIPFLLRDHKQIGEGDSGPMTGGMGAAGPLPNYKPDEVEELGRHFVAPIVKELGFKGLLFTGLKGPKSEEQNLEYNARFGDPETQAFLHLMESDLLPVLISCSEGSLGEIPAPKGCLNKSVVCLVLAAEGYPRAYQTGVVIEGVEEVTRIKGVKLLQAGTDRRGPDLVTNGGRVLNIVSLAGPLDLALRRAYDAAEHITFDGKKPVMRADIGCTVLQGQKLIS